MKNLKHISYTLSVIMVIILLFSCQNNESNTETTQTTKHHSDSGTPENTDLGDEEINRTNAVLSLPELNFNGEILNILYVGEEVYRQDIYAESNGDVVDEAVYLRNLTIEELLNVKLNLIKYSDATLDTSNHLAQVVLAGDDLYDLCSTHQAYTVKYVTEGYFYNLAGDEYIDWEKPWWNLEYMREMIVGDDIIFFLQGDISLMRMKSLGSVYYNKDIYENLFGNRNELYDIVFDGKWTIDKFAELTRAAYIDFNGNGVADTGDQFGSFMTTSKSVEHFHYASGILSTKKNSDGFPEFVLNSEKTINFVEKFYALYYENPGSVVYTSDTFAPYIVDFVAGNYLFAPIWFRHADELRGMETEFGIINFPKYDESEEYQALVHDGTTVFSVPVTSQKTNIVGAVCEAMAFYNYKTVIPAYYETALKVKYSRDEISSQILDLISDTAFTNFGYVYSLNLNGLAHLRGLMSAKTKDFVSWYESKLTAAQVNLDEIIELYTNIGG